MRDLSLPSDISIQKLKIALVVPSLDRKGPVIVARNIGIYMINMGHQVDFISLRSNRPSVVEKYKKDGFAIHEIGMGSVPGLTDILKCNSLFKEYNIVHTHAFWPTIIGAITMKAQIVTVHNIPLEDYRYEYGFTVGSIMEWAFSLSASRHNRVVCISRYVAQTLRTSKKIVIYNGVPDRLAKFRRFNTSQSEALKIVSVGVLSKLKNHSELIELVNACRIRGLKLECDLIGADGGEEAKIRDLIRSYQLQNVVRMHGSLSQDGVYQLLRESDLLVHTSLSEGFGLVVAEAFMLERPVLIKNSGVASELVDTASNGFVYTTHSDFINAVNLILDDRATVDSWGGQARQSYINKFDFVIMGKKYEDLYMKVCK